MSEETYTECRLKLNYASLAKLTLLLGFSAGVVAIPFVLLLASGSGKFNLVSVIFVSPITGALAGLLMAVLGYPVYSWIIMKIGGQVYSGFFQVNAESMISTENRTGGE